jgi:hypothetical protein
MIRCHSTLMRSFIIAFLNLLPTHTMSTSSPLDDNLLAIEKIVADALAKFSPLEYGDWNGVQVQLQNLLNIADSVEKWDSKQLRKSCRCGLFRWSIQAHIKLETSDRFPESQKNLLLSYFFQVYEIIVIGQMARELTVKMMDETLAKVPAFVKIHELPSLSKKIVLRGCEWQDEDLCQGREELAALLKTYSQPNPVCRSNLDAGPAKIQESAAQLQRLADGKLSPFAAGETGPEGSFSSTNLPGSTAPSGSSLTLFISGSTGSGSGVSAYTRDGPTSGSSAAGTNE